MDIYSKCPVLENENYKIRLIEKSDSEDLLKVYSDKNVLPFLNSDNCDGNFYCARREDMDNAIKWWLIMYHEEKAFVRFSLLDKQRDEVIGTLEMLKRQSEDSYNGCGILRIDVRSDYEKADSLYDIMELFMDSFYDWFDCSDIITKGAVYAVERINALKRMQFVKSDKPIMGHNKDWGYGDYWVRHK